MTFLTKEHHESYPAIDPKRPELSFANKTIIITGAGAGIGRNTVLELVKAGSGPVHIIGRTAKTLEETKAIAEKQTPGAKVVVHAGDISNEAAMKKIAAEVGPWDVYIANAGIFPQKTTVDKADLNKWWQGFEVNVKGTFVQYQAFFPTHRPGASLVGFSTAGVFMPLSTPFLSGGSAYLASKAAETKLLEYIAAENDPNDFQVVIIHPGIVKTAMAEIAEVPESVQMDDINLSSHFILWAASKEAKFLHGRFIMVNWDVEELKANADKLSDENLFTLDLVR